MNLKRRWVLLITLALFSLGISLARAESEKLECRQRTGDFLEPALSSTNPELKYAPSREIDILHLALDVIPDFQQRTVEGKATLRFKPIAMPFQELKLDAVDLTIHSVTATEKIMGWQATDKNLILTFDQAIAPGKEASVTIAYHARPEKGLYFRTPEMGYKPEDTHLWTQGETSEARYWYPCFDAPNEKFTSEITCRVPQGMVVLSNGKLVSEEKDSGSGPVAVRWLQDKPSANYLIFLAAGNFKKIEDRYKDVPLAFYTPASEISLAKNSFSETKDMVAFFEQETGVPYPWAKYDQVYVNDFGWGGMENTSITCLNDSTLHPPEFENLRDSQGLVAHELAHQWFGDLVTCKDWANTWLNEGFATYYEMLYDAHKKGPDALRLRLYQSAKHIVSQNNQSNAIVRRDYRSPDEMFNFLAYPKGAWVLHMLRSQLGPELYRQCVKAYLQRYQFNNVTTEDFKAVLEELSGRSLDQFFDQWVYHAAQPELSVSYSWDERAKLAKLSIQQNQKTSSEVLLFNFPLPIRLILKNSTKVDKTITVKEKSEDFYLPLPEAPELVRIDPGQTVLAKINFTPPSAMLYKQLEDKSDALGRVVAAEQLSGKKDALEKLKTVLNKDSFYAARIAACESIRAMQSDEAFEALLASAKQSDARVRRQVTSDLAEFYREKSSDTLLRIAQDEKNPEIRAQAIRALGAYSRPEIREKLLTYLNSTSFRNILADAAISAMRAQADPAYIEPLRQALQKNEAAFTTGGISQGMMTLALLAAHEEKKDAVREYLMAQLNSPKRRVRTAAMVALGNLGDPKAIAVLEKFTAGVKDTPERSAAEKALNLLRDGRKPSVELGVLRREVLTLQKDNRELRKDLDELKKKLDALGAPQKKGRGDKVTR